MAPKDRTAEFRTIVQSENQRNFSAARKNNNNSNRSRSSDFYRMAKSIQSDINSTFSKLEKLALLAKKRSFFDDRPVEIQELTYMIKHDISTLNQNIAKLKQSQQAATKDREQPEAHASSVVFSLQSRLASMSSSFKDTLELRTKNLQEQKTRQSEFSSRNSSAANLIQSAETGSLLYNAAREAYVQRQDSGLGAGSAVAIDISPAADPVAYQQMQIVQQNSAYIQDRSAAVDQINRTIAELGTIFTQLASLVQEQGQQVQRIDDNVADVEQHVEGAHTELLKYLASISSSRWLMVKIFLVLLVFFIFFVVFVL